MRKVAPPCYVDSNATCIPLGQKGERLWNGSSSSRIRRQTLRNMSASQRRLHEPREEESNGARKRKTRSHHPPPEQVGLPVRVALSRDPGRCTAVGSSALMTTVQCASSKGETTKEETKNGVQMLHEFRWDRLIHVDRSERAPERRICSLGALPGVPARDCALNFT